jgi:hypothetical protein
MIEEEEPRAVGIASVGLHSVVMDLDRVALLIIASASWRVAGLRYMMCHHVHVRLEADIGGHGGADACGAAGYLGAAMDVVDLHDRGLRMVKSCRSLDVVR